MLPIFSAYIHSTFSFHSQSCFRSALVTFNRRTARLRESDKNWRETFFSNLIKFLFSFFAISVCSFRFKIIEIRRVNNSRRKCKHLSTQIWAILVWNCEKKIWKEKIFSRKSFHFQLSKISFHGERGRKLWENCGWGKDKSEKVESVTMCWN